MFEFLKVLIKPLWGISIIVFVALIIIISLTLIKEAKKRQKGIKPKKIKADFYREVEAYSEIETIRIVFPRKNNLNRD